MWDKAIIIERDNANIVLMPFAKENAREITGYIQMQKLANNKGFAYEFFRTKNLASYNFDDPNSRLNGFRIHYYINKFNKNLYNKDTFMLANSKELPLELRQNPNVNWRTVKATYGNQDNNARVELGCPTDTHPVFYYYFVWVGDQLDDIITIRKCEQNPIVVTAVLDPGGSGGGGSGSINPGYWNGILNPGGLGSGSGSGYGSGGGPNNSGGFYYGGDPNNWGGPAPGGVSNALSIFTSSLSPSHQLFWNNFNNQEFVNAFIDYLTTNNFDINSQSHIVSLIEMLVSNLSIITVQEVKNYFLTNAEGQDGTYDAAYWENPSLTFPAQNLPKLSAFINGFPKIVNGNSISAMPSRQVYDLVGGNMKTQHYVPNPNYQNACAIRGSRGLNYSITNQPFDPTNYYNNKIPDGTSGTEKGSDNLNYILSAKAFNTYMNKTFGAPTHRLTQAQIGGNLNNISNFLKGKTGIYSMLINGQSYTGHVDLIYNGIVLGGSAIGSNASSVSVIEIWTLN